MTVVNPSPQLFFDRLAAMVEQLCAAHLVLRQVIASAEGSTTLSNEQLRDQLIALADQARHFHPSAVLAGARDRAGNRCTVVDRDTGPDSGEDCDGPNL